MMSVPWAVKVKRDIYTRADLEQEEDCQVAQDSAALIQTPEHSGVPARGGGGGVDGEELTLATRSFMSKYLMYLIRTSLSSSLD